MTTTDETALLAAIEANPDDDGPRLAYADHLDETHGGVACTECPHDDGGEPHPADIPCQRCHGARFLPHPRAEFIRVQCELARHPELDRHQIRAAALREVTARMSRLERNQPESVLLDKAIRVERRIGEERTEIRRRLRSLESALLRQHEADWRKAGPCPECEGGRITSPRRRGQAVQIAGSCHVCHGTGDRGGLLQLVDKANHYKHTNAKPQLEFLRPVQFRRGFIEVVSAEMGQVFERVTEDCPECEGLLGETVTVGRVCRTCGNRGNVTEWRPTPWALAVVREHRTVREARLTDRDCGDGAKSFHRGITTDERYDIPEPLFDAVYALRLHCQRDGNWLYFRTREDGNTALGRAVAALLRDWKG